VTGTVHDPEWRGSRASARVGSAGAPATRRRGVQGEKRVHRERVLGVPAGVGVSGSDRCVMGVAVARAAIYFRTNIMTI
jgi:hypothetical protein